jgi:hypothetical protein
MLKQLSIALLALGLAGAAAADATEAGTVKTAKGAVSVERAGQKIAAAPGVKVYAADRVLTGADGSVGITLRDNTLLSAGPNSTLALEKFAFDPTTHAGAIDATLKRGTLSVISGKIAKASPDAVTFRTPTTTLGVRGTEFVIEAADRGD